jgi:hypothetical protein
MSHIEKRQEMISYMSALLQVVEADKVIFDVTSRVNAMRYVNMH